MKNKLTRIFITAMTFFMVAPICVHAAPYAYGKHRARRHRHKRETVIIYKQPISYRHENRVVSGSYGTTYTTPSDNSVNPQGLYAALRLGVGMPNSTVARGKHHRNKDSAAALGIDLGVNLTPNIGLETGLMFLPSQNQKQGKKGNSIQQTDNQFSDLALKLSAVVSPNVALYGKFGAAYVSSTTYDKHSSAHTSKATVPYLAIGALAQLTSQIGVDLQCEATTKPSGNPSANIPAMGAFTFGFIANF